MSTRKWYATPGSDNVPPCIRRGEDEDGETYADWVCYLQIQPNRKLADARAELIAMLPELVEAAGLAADDLPKIPADGGEEYDALRSALKTIRRAQKLIKNEPA